MVNRILFFLLFVGTFPLFAVGNRFRVMFYNTENFFDCEHDTLKNDYEFLPESMHAWTYSRFKQKASHIARVIATVGEGEPPALVGLCEIENDHVMKQLVDYSPLKELGYRYVMTHSADERGIDVALLYQREVFRLVQKDTIRPNLLRPTRDILHVAGIIESSDTLDVFVCHPPSRMGGQLISEPARLQVAALLRHAADSIIGLRIHPQVLIMGDFNDYPDNRSIAQVLGAKEPDSVAEGSRLYNLMADKQGNRDFGSYKFHGDWGILDQIIVSGTLLQPGAPFVTDKQKAHIARIPFLMESDEKYFGEKPFRTYYGMKYQGGYSDHLPVYTDFYSKEE